MQSTNNNSSDDEYELINLINVFKFLEIFLS